MAGPLPRQTQCQPAGPCPIVLPSPPLASLSFPRLPSHPYSSPPPPSHSSYRRVELRIDAANARARKSAERVGFFLEGVLRKHRVVRSANRDTALYSMTNGDWRDGAAARLARLVRAPDQEDIAGPDARKAKGTGRSTL